jgi:hypothetical protein
MAQQKQHETGNTGNRETRDGSHPIRTAGCAFKNVRPFDGALSQLLDVRAVGPREER